ncbi:hypothetical protein GDO78_013635 [Eleutherodactylus coqui]|uniref:Uncharacterized protein n=1 Tax=Eleutherodactylus coqui TaxID=57060 RepID=A0A8J6BG61_ELECQ|nr:hypothetical protein GDO78_013635 [Eleutherodactylus coqui]
MKLILPLGSEARESPTMSFWGAGDTGLGWLTRAGDIFKGKENLAEPPRAPRSTRARPTIIIAIDVVTRAHTPPATCLQPPQLQLCPGATQTDIAGRSKLKSSANFW